MPIEIRELVVKASIVGEKKENPSEPAHRSALNQERIIETCVEQVLTILESKNER